MEWLAGRGCCCLGQAAALLAEQPLQLSVSDQHSRVTLLEDASDVEGKTCVDGTDS